MSIRIGTSKCVFKHVCMQRKRSCSALLCVLGHTPMMSHVLNELLCKSVHAEYECVCVCVRANAHTRLCHHTCFINCFVNTRMLSSSVRMCHC